MSDLFLNLFLQLSSLVDDSKPLSCSRFVVSCSIAEVLYSISWISNEVSGSKTGE